MTHRLSAEDEDRLMNGGEPQNYDEWLFVSGSTDSPEARGWYDCPDDERGQYINDHRDWWDKF